MLSKCFRLLEKVFPSKKVEFIERIEIGYSNHVYRVGLDGEVYKLRIADNNNLISRKNEKKIIDLLSLDEFIYYDEQTGNSIGLWYPGANPQRSDINFEFLDKLIDAVENIHSFYSPEVLQHDDFEFFESTRELINDSHMDRYKRLVDKYKHECRVFCHNDISLSNLIYNPDNNTLKIIDYEWGRINHPYWDYGNFIKEADLNDELIEYLSKRANLDVDKLLDFTFIATLYSLQLSFSFQPQTNQLEMYRSRLLKQLEKFTC